MNDEPIRVGGVPEHFNLPWHLALGSEAIVDLEVEWEDQPGGTGQMLAGLAEGELDLVSILTEGTVSAIAGGLDAVIIQVYVASPLQWGIFVPANSNLEQIDQLEGRSIAISRLRSGSHLMAFVLAQNNGWKISEEQFVIAGGLEGARTSFATGQSEVFLWDQFMTRPLVEAGEFRQVGVLPTAWPSFVFAATTEAITGRTTQIGRIVDAVVAEATALHGLYGAVEMISARYGLNDETAAGWLETTKFAPRQPMDSGIADNVLATLESAGFLG